MMSTQFPSHAIGSSLCLQGCNYQEFLPILMISAHILMRPLMARNVRCPFISLIFHEGSQTPLSIYNEIWIRTDWAHGMPGWSSLQIVWVADIKLFKNFCALLFNTSLSFLFLEPTHAHPGRPYILCGKKNASWHAIIFWQVLKSMNHCG